MAKVMTTIELGEEIRKDHWSVLKLVKTYKKHLEDFGTVEFTKVSTGGRPIEFATLNHRQTALVILLMKNDDNVIYIKKQMIRAAYPSE